MFSSSDSAEVRYVVQRILVPCVFVIGLLGNSVSIYVLTRRRMRCTTNIYLTALAATDIAYLTMTFILSLQHYDSVRHYWKFYWMSYGVLVWLCDASAYISIYIAVCFTIERFIAIRYPLRRQTFCTESLAKRVITGVALFCLLSTLSTAFEHQHRVDYKLLDSQGKPCNLTSNVSKPQQMSSMRKPQVGYNEGWQGSGNGSIQKQSREEKRRDLMAQQQQTAIDRSLREYATNIPSITSEAFSLGNVNALLLDAEFLVNSDSETLFWHMQMQNDTKPEPIVKIQKQQQSMTPPHNKSSIVVTNVTEYCQNVTFYYNTGSSLANNTLYTRIWYFFTLFVFVLIPLCMLVTFNCFLIMLVRRSKSLRGEMTNANSIRRSRLSKRKATLSSVSQENRVTVTLIAVVLLFIVCQLPWATYLILSDMIEIDHNVSVIMGNICNFLTAINAAANFFLYCVLSDKYRKTVRELITGYRYRAQRSIHTSLYTGGNSNAAINGSRRYRTTEPAISLKGNGSGKIIIA